MPEVDIEVDDFLSNCSSWDRKEIINALVEDGYIKPAQLEEEDNTLKVSCVESTYQEALSKLMSKWNCLSKEDEETILKIANKF